MKKPKQTKASAPQNPPQEYPLQGKVNVGQDRAQMAAWQKASALNQPK